MNSLFINLSVVTYFLSGVLYFTNFMFKKKTGRIFANALFILGFLLLTLATIIRWHQAGRPPLTNLYESLIFFAWSVTLVYLVFEVIYKLRFLGAPICLLIIILLSFSSLLDDTIMPLMPALQSNWLVIHVVSYFLAYGAVCISFILSLIYLAGSRKSYLESSRLDYLDTLSYRLIAFSFPFLTIGLTTGAVWANVAWGSYWSWDPKETWSLITWLIYALYLHLRLMRGWNGRKIAYLNIAGFLAVLFTFFGVSFILPGLHSYL